MGPQNAVAAVDRRKVVPVQCFSMSKVDMVYKATALSLFNASFKPFYPNCFLDDDLCYVDACTKLQLQIPINASQ